MQANAEEDKRNTRAKSLEVSTRELVYGSAVGLFLLILSLFINFAANKFATSHISNSVNDIILDNIPTFNVDFVFFQGFGLFLAFVFFLLVKEPRRIPFALKAIATFIIVRSAFIILTHIGPPPNEMFFDPGAFSKKLTAGGDIFFSSHTGLPFLMTLLFWENKIIRNIFLTTSLVFGAAVLLGHMHYSIDVFSAFFITYGIFHIARTFFAKDYKMFLHRI